MKKSKMILVISLSLNLLLFFLAFDSQPTEKADVSELLKAFLGTATITGTNELDDDDPDGPTLTTVSYTPAYVYFYEAMKRDGGGNFDPYANDTDPLAVDFNDVDLEDKTNDETQPDDVWDIKLIIKDGGVAVAEGTHWFLVNEPQKKK